MGADGTDTQQRSTASSNPIFHKSNTTNVQDSKKLKLNPSPSNEGNAPVPRP